jgi:hypothetical protein
VRLCKADHAYFVYHMLQRQLSHLNGRKLVHRQVLSLLRTFSMSRFTLFYAAKLSFLMILYDLCLLPGQLCYIYGLVTGLVCGSLEGPSSNLGRRYVIVGISSPDVVVVSRREGGCISKS